MFPATNKDYRQLLLQPSPKYSRDVNKSTYLPYYKRLSHQKYLSQERKRTEQPNILQFRRFFTEQTKEEEQKEPSYVKQFSNGNIRELSHNKIVSKLSRPPLERKTRDRDNSKIKRISEPVLAERTNKILANTSFNTHHSAALTPAQVLRAPHNLTEAEVAEIQDWEEIFYYGQNCLKKLYRNEKTDKPKDGNEGYPWAKGDHINYRYQIVDMLGEGSFGQVFKCLDHKYNSAPVAVKMVKNNDKYLTQAQIEIKILSLIKSKDPVSANNCIDLKNYFPFRKRICMCFGLMSINLYELIKSNGYYGLPLDLIRRFVLQLLNSIHFLHKNKIIHADLKPENILLKEANKSGIKIIDFGSSCMEGETIYTYIQSRYYRAPEVILGLAYDRKIDIWSFGCIVAELHLGYPLFGGENEHEQMCLLTEVLGLPPREMIPNSKRWNVFFDSSNMLKPHEKRKEPFSKTMKTALEDVDDDFVDFIQQCLQWNPERRTEALQLMKHRWVVKELPADFKQQHLHKIQEEEQQMQEEVSLFRKSKKLAFSIREKYRLGK